MDSKKNVNRALIELTDRIKNYGIDYFVTGSLALREAGISLGREIEDIDIFIRKDGSMGFGIFMNELNVLAASSRVIDSSYPVVLSGFRVFMYLGVKVNVWIVDKLEMKAAFRGIHGIRFCGVMDVLAAKASYGRLKDVRDIQYVMDLMNSIMRDAVASMEKKSNIARKIL